MSERIFTLFGEEIIPEQLKAVGRSRAKKKKDEKTVEDSSEASAEENDAQPVAADTNSANSTADQPQAENTSVPAEHTIQTTEKSATDTAHAGPDDEPTVHEIKPKPANRQKPGDANTTSEKQYYAIGEVAEMFSVKTSNIRFWTNEFKIKVRTTRKGDRLYTPEQIKEIRAIYNLVKDRGFTINGAKAKLAAEKNMEVATVDLRQSLLQLRNQLTAIRNQLK